MITAIVTFGLPEGMSREKWLSLIEPAAARFQNIPGLIRKQFLFGEGQGGGVYLWENWAAAETCYNGPWRESIQRVATTPPQIVYFDTQVVVDNERGDIRVAA
jgi:hypothetical protein